MAKKEIIHKSLTDKEREFLQLLSFVNDVSTHEARAINIFVKSGNEYFTAHNGTVAGYIIKQHDGSKRDKLEKTERPEEYKVCVPLELFILSIVIAEPFEKWKYKKIDWKNWLKSSWNVDKFLKKYPHEPGFREHYIEIGQKFFDIKNIWHTLKALSVMDIHTIDVYSDNIRAVWAVESDDIKIGGAFMGMVTLNCYLEKTVKAILSAKDTKTFLKVEK